MATMPGDSQTAAALRLKDETIEHLIDVCDKDANRHERESMVARRYNRVDSMRALNAYASDERLTAAALRDYMRMRKLVNAVKRAFDKCDQGMTVPEDAYGLYEDIKRLLTEMLEGDAK